MAKTSRRDEDPRIISYNTLRKVVGWLGISIPIAMLAVNYVIGQCLYIQPSISNYYYTVSGNLFVAILCGDAVFLIAYKGYDNTDNWLTNLAGFFALLIAFFPTNPEPGDGCLIFAFPINEVRHTIHIVSAAAFFIILVIISMFLFTKSSGNMTPEKVMRNKLYRICGMVILVCIVLIGLYWTFGEGSSLDALKPVFILESIALFAFGMSWLVKGELLMEDED